MATLINYNLSTFRDHAKANGRRLQELQHTEARAHAARVAYWRKRKSQARLKSTRLARAEKGPEAPAFEDAELDLEFSNQSLATSRTGGKVSATTAVVRKTSAESKPIEESTLVGQEFGDLSVFIQLSSQPTSRLFDPFDTLPCRQGEEVVTAMHHFVHTWAPSQWPGLRFPMRHNPLIRDVFPAALQNVELFEASVALCLSFRAAISNFLPHFCNASLYHKGEALAGIRKKLTSGRVDAAVILATVLLMINDNVFLDMDAYRFHLTGLRKMVIAGEPSIKEAYGGLLTSFVSWAESNAAVIFDDRKVDEISDLTGSATRSSSQLLSNAVPGVVSELTPAFQALASEEHFSSQTMTILELTVRWTRIINTSLTSTSPDDDQLFLKDFDPRKNSASAMELFRMVGQQKPSERALCKALFIYHANMLNWSCRCTGYKRVVEELSESLSSVHPQTAIDMAFWSWIALLTTNAARRGHLLHAQSEAIARFFFWTSRDEPWDQVVESLKKFLFHDGLGGEWRLCWGAGVNHIVL